MTNYQDSNKFSLIEIQNSFIKKILPNLKKEYGFEVLFGNVDGSLVRGMSNATSDIDINLFGHFATRHIEDQQISITSDIRGEIVAFGITMREIDRALDKLTSYNKKKKQYPTNLFRNREEKAFYSQMGFKYDFKRADSERYELFTFLAANYSFKAEGEEFSEYVANNYRLIDILDAQFIRAYGNYYEWIVNSDKVIVRKYINTLWELMYCKWVEQFNTKPDNNFNNLRRVLLHEQVINNEIDKLLDVHKKSKQIKEYNYIKPNAVLNDYIEKEIESITKYIKNIDTNVVWSELPQDNRVKQSISIINY